MGRLSDEREWFVQTPVEMVVENGVVKRVSGELPNLGDVGIMPEGEFFAVFPLTNGIHFSKPWS